MNCGDGRVEALARGRKAARQGPAAVLACPRCGPEPLLVIDTPVDDSHIERHLMCTFCNAYNALRMRRPGRYDPLMRWLLLVAFSAASRRTRQPRRRRLRPNRRASRRPSSPEATRRDGRADAALPARARRRDVDRRRHRGWRAIHDQPPAASLEEARHRAHHIVEFAAKKTRAGTASSTAKAAAG